MGPAAVFSRQIASHNENNDLLYRVDENSALKKNHAADFMRSEEAIFVQCLTARLMPWASFTRSQLHLGGQACEWGPYLGSRTDFETTLAISADVFRRQGWTFQTFGDELIRRFEENPVDVESGQFEGEQILLSWKEVEKGEKPHVVLNLAVNYDEASHLVKPKEHFYSCPLATSTRTGRNFITRERDAFRLDMTARFNTWADKHKLRSGAAYAKSTACGLFHPWACKPFGTSPLPDVAAEHFDLSKKSLVPGQAQLFRAKAGQGQGSILLPLGNPDALTTSALINLCSMRESLGLDGFVALSSGEETELDNAGSEIGCVVLNGEISRQDLGPLTLGQIPEKELKTLLKQRRTVARRNVPPGQIFVISLSYFNWLLSVRGFKNFQIEHLVLYNVRPSFRRILTMVQQLRHELKLKGLKHSLKSLLLKLFANGEELIGNGTFLRVLTWSFSFLFLGFYGYSLLEVSRFFRTLIVDEDAISRLSEQCRIELLAIYIEKSTDGKKKGRGLYLVTLPPKFEDPQNLIQVGATILSHSKVQILDKIVFISNCLRPVSSRKKVILCKNRLLKQTHFVFAEEFLSSLRGH